MLRNITRHQLLAIEHVATGLVNAWINPLRRDAELLKKSNATSVISTQNQFSKEETTGKSIPFGYTYTVEKRLPNTDNRERKT